MIVAISQLTEHISGRNISSKKKAKIFRENAKHLFELQILVPSSYRLEIRNVNHYRLDRFSSAVVVLDRKVN